MGLAAEFGRCIEPDRLVVYRHCQLEIQARMGSTRASAFRAQISPGMDLALGTAICGKSHSDYSNTNSYGKVVCRSLP